MYYSQSENLASAELDDEVCIFNPHEGNYLNLNETASAIWRLLNEPKQLKDIVEYLTNNYMIDKEICLQQILDFMEDAKKSKIIKEIEKL